MKTLPVLQKNKLTVFQELTGTGQEFYKEEESTFRIFLYGEGGEELRGIYPYEGSKTGVLRSGGSVSLRGNQYITIETGKLNPNIRYKVVRQEDGKTVTSWNWEGQIGEEAGACAVFTRNVTDTRERTRFVKGQSYILKETITYSDGEKRTGRQVEFMVNEEAAIDTMVGFDRHVQVTITKEDLGGEEVPGASLQVTDEQGKVLEQWVSGKEPYRITAVLEPGKRYILHEELAPDGYGYSMDIAFTVSEEGVTEQVIMVDKPTRARFQKTDITGEKEVSGAVMQILDLDGTIIETWTSTEEPHEINGKLIAGKEYILHEEYAPKGYAYGTDIRFLVPKDGQPVLVSMKDELTHVVIQKTDITGEKEGHCFKLQGLTAA